MPSTSGEPRIVIHTLSHHRHDGHAIFLNGDLSFARRRYGLIGDNGSGKTTLLKLIAGEITPDSGVVCTGGSISFVRQHRTLADTLSGGEARRAELRAAIADKPDFLLLDEPTNHLDRAGREWLYRFIDSWSDGLIVASHDRELLEHVDEIVEIQNGELRRFGGPYSFYAEQRARLDVAATRALQGANAELARERRDLAEALERTQRRNASAKRRAPKSGIPNIILGTRKNQAQVSASKSKLLHVDRVHAAADLVDAARARVSESQAVAFDAQQTYVPSGAIVVEVRNFNVSFPDGTKLWQNVFSFSLLGPQRISVLGENGRGKSFLLREVARAARVPVAYLDQDLSLLRGFQTAADVMRAFAPHLREDERRTRLARAGFTQERGTAAVSELSGGERMRLAICAVLSQERVPKLLILDEPANDLDVRSLEMLAHTLRAFRGAMLVVSHDESFLREAGVDEALTLPPRAWAS